MRKSLFFIIISFSCVFSGELSHKKKKHSQKKHLKHANIPNLSQNQENKLSLLGLYKQQIKLESDNELALHLEEIPYDDQENVLNILLNAIKPEEDLYVKRHRWSTYHRDSDYSNNRTDSLEKRGFEVKNVFTDRYEYNFLIKKPKGYPATDFDAAILAWCQKHLTHKSDF